MQVCVRCETPFDEVTADDVDLALPRPAAPSPTQSHGTVMVALLSGFVVLAVLLWLSVRGVGPFDATIVKNEPIASGTRLTLTIENTGRKSGHAKCTVQRVLVTTGDLQQNFTFLSNRIGAHASITQTVDVPLTAEERTGQVDC